MGVIIGVMVGYALGTRAGQDGWEEFQDSWKVIATSEEVRDLLAGGFAIARDVLGKGSGVLAEILGEPADKRSLRSVA
jgi:hypothetical protein